MGNVARAKCGAHIFRILLADYLIAVDTKMTARLSTERTEGL
jgi:hypothetical protein